MHPDITADQLMLAAAAAGVVRKLEQSGWLGPRFRAPSVRWAAGVISAGAFMGLLHLGMGWELGRDFLWESLRQGVFQWAGVVGLARPREQA